MEQTRWQSLKEVAWVTILGFPIGLAKHSVSFHQVSNLENLYGTITCSLLGLAIAYTVRRYNVHKNRR